ncbi:MAG: methyltransferase, partial [Bacteroidetes bacterium]
MKAPDQEHPCPLCGNADSYSFFVDKFRHYQRCSGCELVFVPRRYWLSTMAEKATYDLHENSAEDPGYRCFLSRLSTPLVEKLETGQTGLDFGCGPDPALPALLEEQGFWVDLYDPFYYNEPVVFSKAYDFICATEVVEHLQDPGNEFSSLFGMLKPGGWLGIMT